MRVQIQKWGDRLAICIPKSFVKETNIDNGSFLDVALVKGKFVATPIIEEKYSLNALLAQVTDENIHSEIDAGASIGKENC